MSESKKIITADKVQHWADCAALTSEQSSVIHTETIAAIARQLQMQDEVIAARVKVIAELDKKLKDAEDAFQQNEQTKQELFVQRDQLLTANLNVGKELKKGREANSAYAYRVSELERKLEISDSRGKLEISDSRGDMYAEMVRKFADAIPKEVEEDGATLHSLFRSQGWNQAIRVFQRELRKLL